MRKLLQRVWAQHVGRTEAAVLRNATRPGVLAIMLVFTCSVIALMGYVPQLEAATGFRHPAITLACCVFAIGLSGVLHYVPERWLPLFDLLDTAAHATTLALLFSFTRPPISYCWAGVYAITALFWGFVGGASVLYAAAVFVTPVGAALLCWPDITLLGFVFFGITVFPVAASHSLSATRRRARELASAHAELKAKLSEVVESEADLAHELKQPLAIIRGFSERLERRPHLSAHEHTDELRFIREAAERMTELVESMRLLSSERVAAFAPVEPLAALDAALERVRPQLVAAGIVWRWSERAALGLVRGDRDLLGHAFLNLLTNAREALVSLPEGERRVLTLGAGVADEVLIEVADCGLGISPEHQHQLFVTGFTTKRHSGGTGQGLLITRRIIEAHQGRVWHEPLVPHGARMLVALPRYVPSKGAVRTHDTMNRIAGPFTPRRGS